MDEIIAWGRDPLLVGIAGLSSVLGFLLSIIIIGVTIRVNQKINKKMRIYTQVEKYNKNRLRNREKLLFFQKIIVKDNILNIEITMGILNEIGYFSNFSSLLSIVDWFHLWQIKRELNKKDLEINKSKVAKKLSYFISRYTKEEEIILHD